jgi:hypothetical protein
MPKEMRAGEELRPLELILPGADSYPLNSMDINKLMTREKLSPPAQVEIEIK